MISVTATRVQKHTAPYLNRRIRHEIQERIAMFEGSNKTVAITKRLHELDQEWEIERVLQTHFAIFSMIGLVLANTKSKRWFTLALGVPVFMLQHSLQGWCPPLSILRWLGFRTSKEINEERFALKSLRGDFSKAADSGNAKEILRAVKS